MKTIDVRLALKEDDADLKMVIVPNANTDRGNYYLTDDGALALAFALLEAVIQGKRAL